MEIYVYKQKQNNIQGASGQSTAQLQRGVFLCIIFAVENAVCEEMLVNFYLK